MTEPRHPRVRELVAELVENAPPAPPFPLVEADTVAVSPRRPMGRTLLVAAVLLVVLAVALGAIALIGGRADERPTAPPATTVGAVAYVGRDGLYVRLA